MSSEPTRVCFILGAMNLGGIGRNSLNLATEMARRGIAVDIFVAKESGEYLSELPVGVTLVTGGGSARGSLPALVRYFKQRRPYAVITAHTYMTVLTMVAHRLASSRARIIVTVRTQTSVELAASPTLWTRLMVVLMRLFYPRANAVVAVSNGVADDVAQITGIRRSSVRTIYNPAVTPALLESARSQVTHPWLIDPELPVVLTAGRLTKQKDLPTLLRAFAEIRRVVPSRLILLGEGEDRAALEALTAELALTDVVSFPGFAPNPAAYMARATVFVLSSAWEGFGNVLVEAMATGTPVVTTDCPSGPAEIVDGGRYGQIVPVGDVAALARAVIDVLRNPPDRNVTRARGLEFTVERACDRYFETLGLPTPGGAAVA